MTILSFGETALVHGRIIIDYYARRQHMHGT